MSPNPHSSAAPGPDLNTLYLKRVLLPFWVVRLFLMGLFTIVYIVAIIAVSSADVDDDGARGTVIGICAALLVLCLICKACDITCLILFIRHKLKPLVLLIFNCVETLIWLVLFILQIAGTAMAKKNGHTGSGFTWLISIVTLASFVGLLIYASVIYHRFRKSARYNPASTVESQESTSYQMPMQAQFPGGGATEYYSPSAQQSGYAPVAAGVPVPPQYSDRQADTKGAGFHEQPVELSSRLT